MHVLDGAELSISSLLNGYLANSSFSKDLLKQKEVQESARQKSEFDAPKSLNVFLLSRSSEKGLSLSVRYARPKKKR